MEQDNLNIDQSLWNFGGKQLEVISKLFEKASNGYQEGDLKKWFYSLKGMKLQIIYKLNDEEYSKCKKLEIEIYNLLKEYNTNKILKNKVGTKIEYYDYVIKKLLDKYKFLSPNKDKTTNFFGQED